MVINTEALGKNLSQVQYKIEQHTKELKKLHSQKDEMIRFCFDNGMSAIKIAEVLGCTRQRVYAILDNTRLEVEIALD